MKELSSITRRKKPKLKLICSFNGAFQPRPPSGKLRYIGGETRILSVDKNFSFSFLKSKVLELFPFSSNSVNSFSLVYHLPNDDASLVLITCDDDVLCMIQEYEKLELCGMCPRLWLFVCYGNVIDHKFCLDYNNCNDVSNKVKKQVVRASDDSLRKIVLKQQLLAKQTAKSTDCRLGLLETELEYDDEKIGSDNLGGILNSEQDSPLSTLEGENCGGRGHFTVPCSNPLNPTDFNVRVVESGIPGDGGRTAGGGCGQFGSELRMNMVSYMNRENIVPRGLKCNIVQTEFAPLYFSGGDLDRNGNGGIPRHQFGLCELRNPRAFPYQVKNHRNTHTEMGNPGSTRLDGRPWMGKLQNGLRLSSNIIKEGQYTKAHYHSSWKPSSDSYPVEVEGEGSATDNGPLFNVACGGLETLAYEDPSFKERHLGLPFNAIDNTARFERMLSEQIDDSTSPVHELHKLPQPTVLETPTSAGDGDIKVATKQFGNEIWLRSDDKQFGKEKAGSKSSIKFHKSALTLHGGTGTSSSLGVSFRKEINPPITSLTAVNYVAEALVKTQSKLFDKVDEEHFSLGPQFEKSSEATSVSSLLKHEKDDDEKTKTVQEHESNSIIDEKDNLKFLTINGGIPADLAAFYTHLATRELQTINNSDLEYIKELGSGTYGTVFYGKWKGSDVAIKKIKPSCLSEGAVEEDRLVADFWKEAHILGQLHHPNIVALYGVVTDGPVTNLATVTEYMVNGSLKQVFRRKDRTIDRRKRLIIAMDAAFGMEYLHGKNIVHFDLKSHNFLVNMRDPQRPVCKIGDLGLSKFKQKTLVSGGVRGTIPWMAPELLNINNMVTEKVDVYSFGIVMWELLTGEEPYAKMKSEDMIGGIIKGTLRPEIPRWCDPIWRSLMERCWSSNPEERPDFSEIAKELRAMAAAMNIK